ncbi:MAG: phage holin family protein [Bacteroidota bacterium]
MLSGKWIAGIIGGVVGYLSATGWLMLISIMMVLYDSYTAWELSYRVKKRFPGLSDGKFKSNAALKAIKKIRDYCLVIILAYMIQDKIVIMFNLYLPYVAAGIFVFVEFWSILENKSSCNGGKWAQVLQKVMVDKTARHFNMEVNELNAILKGHAYNKNDYPPSDHSGGDVVPGDQAAG